MKSNKHPHNIPRKPNARLRNEFRKQLLIAVGCALFIYYLADAKPPWSYLVLLALIIGGIQLIQIIKRANEIVDDYFPPKLYHEPKPSRFNSFMYFFCSYLIIPCLVSLMFEIPTFADTVQASKLFWTGSFFGLCLGLLVIILLKLSNPSLFYEGKRRFAVSLGLPLGLFLLIPATLSFVNAYFAEDQIKCSQFKVESKEINIDRRRRRTGYRINLKADGAREERFTITKNLYDQLEEGGEVELCMQKGKLGFNIVTEFRAPINHSF